MAEELIALEANPMRHPGVLAELPQVRTAFQESADEHDVIHLSRPTAEKLLSCPKVPEPRRARYVLGLLSGLRDGELAALTWADIDLGERSTVRVCKSFSVEHGIGKTKNKRNRTAPLHSNAARALRAWRGRGWVELVGRQSTPQDPVFPNTDGHGKAEHARPKSADCLRRDLRNAGLPDKYQGHPLSFHALRRSFASFLSAAGVPEDVRKRLMGHAATGVTSAHYTARDLESLRPHVESIPLDLAGGQVVYLRAVGADDPERTPAPVSASREVSRGPREVRGKWQP